ncbi:hypothetical protein RJ640_012177 [Escallonia rubra]|uniref:Retroviral polymerase SH3-like domain-containing protein n=1 Tax=Escallonia rubra TaxID=112253 RepID=A0AA88R268_9ASTE|nr:hypothetical protein RJ640_012177 [Escallonia rubra]
MDPAQPIFIILDGSNYILWAQAMRSFIKGKKLWRYLTGDITIPIKTADEPQLKFDERLDDWDSKNHQIITWFRNTSVLSIYQQFGRYNTAKEIWDLLAQRYTTADLTHQYQLHDSFHRMKQEPGQSINSFLSQMQGIWDQLELSEPSWTCSEDSARFIVYRDHLRLIQFFMSLTDAYESVQSSLLHWSPLPTLDNAVAELLYEETRQGLLQTRRPDITMSQIGTGHFPRDCPCNTEKWSKNPSSTSAPPKPGLQSRFKPPSHSANDVLNDSSSSALSVNDVAEIVKQIMYNSGTLSSSALSVTSGYGIEHKGYRCWDPISNRLRISRHVVFWEHKMFSSLSSFHLPHSSNVSFFTNSSVPLFHDSDETHIPLSDDFTAPPEMSARPANPVTPDQGPPSVSEVTESTHSLHDHPQRHENLQHIFKTFIVFLLLFLYMNLNLIARLVLILIGSKRCTMNYRHRLQPILGI